MHKHALIGLLMTFVLGLAACSSPAPGISKVYASKMIRIDAFTLTRDAHLVRDFAPDDNSGNINVVVEIPTGTNAKWEVEKSTGHLKWEFKKGKPRMVSYLGYPGNYGMIPRTLLPKELGGDGDPLDVLVLGPALPRGSIVKARVIGVLKLLDGGEQDDKIIAVLLDSKLSKVSSIKELRSKFKGADEIIELWFSNYKGPGKMESKGFAEVSEARRIINAAIEAYRNENPRDSDSADR